MTKPGTTTDPRPDGEPKSTGGLNLRTVLHAVRRHPLAFIGVLLLAGSAAGAVWMFLPLPKNAAAVVYHVNPDPGTLIHELRQVPYPQYKTNQAVILKSRKTLLAILDDPAVRNLPMVPRAEAVPWLDAYLSANYQNVEYFRIMVEGDDPEQLKTLVGAAGRVYERMSRERDNAERNRREGDLVKKYNELRTDLSQRTSRINKIAQQLGSKDAAVIAIIDMFEQNKLQELVTVRTALQAEFETASQDVAAARKQASPRLAGFARLPAVAAVAGPGWLFAKPPGGDLVTPAAIDDLLARDKTLEGLETAVAGARSRLETVRKFSNPGAPALVKAQAELSAAEEARDKHRAVVRPAAVEALHQKFLDGELAEVRAAMGRQDQYQADIAKADQRIRVFEEKIAKRSAYKLELESAQGEIAHKEAAAMALNAEIEKMKLEASAQNRITLAEEPILVPGIEGNRRLKFALLAALVLFVAGFGGLVLWEYRGRRVTHVDDVSSALGTRLVGTIPPLVPTAPGATSGDAHAILVESIDTARNILMHGTPEGADARVLLVTSAVSGEGKTTLSGHLAISLTRAGFRTLLVDGDIHAPSAHLLFGLPDSPGLSEVLRGEVDIAGAVRPSPVAGLSVLPAGRWTLATRQALVGERWRHLKQELKSQFDFVVVDTSPLLLVSDTMLLAREADTVILSVMMGVSQVSRVADTIQRLGAVGAELAGVVVNNVRSDVYDCGYAYRSKYPASPSSAAVLPGAALAAAGDHAKEGDR